jgi:hypothetical protein
LLWLLLEEIAALTLPLTSRVISTLTVLTTLVLCALFTALAATSFADSPLDTAVQKVSDTHWVVERPFAEAFLGNPAELRRAARVVPHEEGGRVIGLKLYGIRRNSLLGKLGLQNADVLHSINGMSPSAALDAFEKLRGASAFRVDITRGARCMSLTYSIVGPRGRSSRDR